MWQNNPTTVTKNTQFHQCFLCVSHLSQNLFPRKSNSLCQFEIQLSSLVEVVPADILPENRTDQSDSESLRLTVTTESQENWWHRACDKHSYSYNWTNNIILLSSLDASLWDLRSAAWICQDQRTVSTTHWTSLLSEPAIDQLHPELTLLQWHFCFLWKENQVNLRHFGCQSSSFSEFTRVSRSREKKTGQFCTALSEKGSPNHFAVSFLWSLHPLEGTARWWSSMGEGNKNVNWLFWQLWGSAAQRPVLDVNNKLSTHNWVKMSVHGL